MYTNAPTTTHEYAHVHSNILCGRLGTYICVYREFGFHKCSQIRKKKRNVWIRVLRVLPFLDIYSYTLFIVGFAWMWLCVTMFVFLVGRFYLFFFSFLFLSLALVSSFFFLFRGTKICFCVYILYAYVSIVGRLLQSIYTQLYRPFNVHCTYMRA